ncbi:hypothetical protein L596_015362 [Steinernema carpocapsae]|uniref:PAZ domain-containing protein n=1 Tax=Steinernema carpocapsae TaxID=34508 RepID=A0A4U5NG17_STECR|nr:hypothetical protein L596_015362 [Steinernema carpocapsae]
MSNNERVKTIQNGMETISISATMPVKKKIANAPGAPLQVATNIYKVGLSQVPIFRYDVDITLKLPNGKDVKVVKKDRADHVIIQNKNKACKTFQKAVQKFPNVFGNVELFYDCQSILFSLRKLNISDKGQEFTLSPNDLPEVYGHVDSVNFIVKSVREKYQLTLNDLGFLSTQEVNGIKHDLAQFIEVATSQNALFNGKHSVYDGGVSYLMSTGEAVRNEPSKQLITGVQKSVRFIEGQGKPEATLVLDLAKTVFHKGGQNLYEKAISSVRNWPRNDQVDRREIKSLSQQFKGLSIKTEHQKTKEYELAGLSEFSAHTHKFDHNGKQMSVAEYFKKQYNKNLMHPNAPLAIAKNFFMGKRNTMMLPLEICTVLPNQKVSKQQETPLQTAAVIRYCAVLPSDRKEQIYTQVKELGFWGNKNLPITVDQQPIVVTGRQLPQPSIVFGGNQTVSVNPANGKWQATKGVNRNARLPFALPGNPMPWAVVLVGQGTQDTAKSFALAVKTECESRGLKMGDPSAVIQANYEDIEINARNNTFENLTKMTPRVKFCLVIENERSPAYIHALIKKNEQNWRIITQVTDSATVQQFNFALGPAQGYGKGQTLENICLKTNVKFGGLNHFIKPPQGHEKVFASDRMYVGLGISHASPISDAQRARNVKPSPSVIGISCNYLAHPQALAGTFVFQEPRENKMVESLKKVFFDLATKFKNIRKVIPKEVVIYRVGASEGQYATILEQEVPQIRAGLKEAGCNAKLVLIVPRAPTTSASSHRRSRRRTRRPSRT